MSTNNGINAKERDMLNYTPHIEYEPARIEAGEYPGPTAVTFDPGMLVKPIMRDTWEAAVEVLEKLKETEVELSAKLANDKIPVPSKFHDVLTEASKKFNHTYEGSISFPLYQVVLNSPDSYEKNLIVDQYEKYHSDVSGNINAELYPEVVDMIKDWESMIEFIKKGLFAQVVPVTDLPTTIDKNDSNLAKVDAAEKALIHEYVTKKKTYEESLDLLREKFLSDANGSTFYQAKYKNTEDEKQLKRVERVIYGKTEVNSLVDSKLLDGEVTTSLIGNTISFQPYKSKTLDILINLLKQYPSRQSLENGLRKIQALVKLTVDGKSDDVANTTSDLRGMSSQPVKDKMNKTLSNGVHLRNNVFGEVHEVMTYFAGMPDIENSGFHPFAEHIVDSVMYADKMYEDQLFDFYKIHTLDAELRKKKLVGVIDKHESREVYQLTEKVLRYAEQSNSWPSEKNLSSWVSTFMQVHNLS